MNFQQVTALTQLSNALVTATPCGALDVLLDCCKSPNSINDVCDSLEAVLHSQQEKNILRFVPFDSFKRIVESSKQISINSTQIVFNHFVDDDVVDLNWIDEDGDRFNTVIHRRYNDGKMYVETDGEIVAFDSEGDIDRIQFYSTITFPELD